MIFLVAYADEEGPYALAFSTRAKAEAYIADQSDQSEYTIIESDIDFHEVEPAQ